MLSAYLKLVRLHRPIGILLLLWPTLWGVWLGGAGHPQIKIILIFILGTFVMRSAGCIINDIADRNFDSHVQRTHDRPLAAGILTVRQALIFFVVLCSIGFVLVLQLNFYAQLLSLAGLALILIYPFMKRVTHFPQFILGLAFSWGILMAFAAQQKKLPLLAWLLFATSVIWALIYDTQYAMADREDDIKIGIKSTAIFLGNYDRIAIATLQILMMALLITVGYIGQLPGIYYVALSTAGLSFLYQQILIYHRLPSSCFKAFLNNGWVGALIFLGILGSF